MPDQPWYAAFFGADYLRIYEPMLSPERAALQAAQIAERLALPSGASILDLCCGHGRLSIPLAQAGYRVTGLDLSEVFLERARADAAAAGANVRWIRSDMRDIPFTAEFDAVINMFTAFAFLETQADDQKVLDSAQRALVPGGLFLIETVLRESIIRNFAAHNVTRLPGDLIVTHERDFDLRSSRMRDRVTLFRPDGARTEYYTDMRFYTFTELEGMLDAAGLELVDFWGGLDASPLTLDSRFLVLLARKPTAP